MSLPSKKFWSKPKEVDTECTAQMMRRACNAKKLGNWESLKEECSPCLYGGGHFTINLVCSARTPPRPTPCGEGVGRPRRLHPSARTRCCTAVAAILSELTCHLRLLGLLVHAQTPLVEVMEDATEHGFDFVWTASVESLLRLMLDLW